MQSIKCSQCLEEAIVIIRTKKGTLRPVCKKHKDNHEKLRIKCDKKREDKNYSNNMQKC